MKHIRYIIIALLIFSAVTACAISPQETQTVSIVDSSMQESASSAESDVSEVVAEPFSEWLSYKTKNEFNNEVINAKRNTAKEDEKTRANNVEGIAWYYDFSDAVKDVILDEIRVNLTYVVLDYRDKDSREPETLLIRCARWDDVDENKYLEKTRSNTKDISVDIKVSGKAIIKQEVYWDNEFLSGHICNQYYWVENGNAIFLRVPNWLLERYPEEIFFDIQMKKI